MNAMFRRSLSEYARQNEAKKTFVAHARNVAERMKQLDFANSAELPFHLANYQKRMLLLLAPLIEIAWADGRITQRESEAILETADFYGLMNCEASYAEIINRLTRRSNPPEVEEFWRRFGQLFLCLDRSERETLQHGLLAQTEFVAERSSNDFIAFLQGVGICENEREVLQKMKTALAQANESAELLQNANAFQINYLQSAKDSIRREKRRESARLDERLNFAPALAF